MLHGVSEMRVARDTETRDKPDAVSIRLAEIVAGARAHRDHDALAQCRQWHEGVRDGGPLVHFTPAAAFRNATVSGDCARDSLILPSTTVPEAALIGKAAFIAAARNSGSFITAS